MMQFSIRSLMLSTFSAAVLCWCFMSVPIPTPSTFVTRYVAFILAWVIPAASLGYDAYRTRRGVVVGASIGVMIAFLAMVWLSTPLSRFLWQWGR